MSEEKTLPSQDDMEKWVLAAASALAPAWRALPAENSPSLGDTVEEALPQQLIEVWRQHSYPTTVLALAAIGLRQCVFEIADELADLVGRDGPLLADRGTDSSSRYLGV